MKVIVASAFEAGSSFAHAINTVRMAGGFAAAGYEVMLICRAPAAGAKPDEELSENYGTDRDIQWVQLDNSLGEGGRFAWKVLCLATSWRPDMVFARNYAVPVFTALAGFPTAMETHAHVGRKSGWFRVTARLAWRRAPFRLITIAKVLADDYAGYGFPTELISVLPTGVNKAFFQRPPKLPARPYEPGRKVAAYVGHLYDYKGIPQILEAAALLPSVDFHLVGGTSEDLARQRERATEMGLGNVVFHGPVQPSKVPPFLWHADVLLVPPVRNHPSSAWTSPVKLGEYMLAGTPVIATDIPALTSLLSEAEVTFVEDTGPSLAAGIRQLLDSPAVAQTKAASALARAAEWTYEGRAKKITAALSMPVMDGMQ